MKEGGGRKPPAASFCLRSDLFPGVLDRNLVGSAIFQSLQGLQERSVAGSGFRMDRHHQLGSAFIFLATSRGRSAPSICLPFTVTTPAASTFTSQDLFLGQARQFLLAFSGGSTMGTASPIRRYR